MWANTKISQARPAARPIRATRPKQDGSHSVHRAVQFVRITLAAPLSVARLCLHGPALCLGVCRCRSVCCFTDRCTLPHAATRRPALPGVLPRMQTAGSSLSRSLHVGAPVPDRRRERRTRPRPRTAPRRPRVPRLDPWPARVDSTPPRARHRAGGGRDRRARDRDGRNGDRPEDQLAPATRRCRPRHRRDPCSCTSRGPGQPAQKFETSPTRSRAPPPPPSSRRFETETTAACSSRGRFGRAPRTAQASLAAGRERKDL